MSSFLFTQVHCISQNHVLLMCRNKNPNKGLWVAPGGKIESDESPFEGAVRELHEETGLTAAKMIFRGMVTLLIPTFPQPLHHFLYLVPEFKGELVADQREGNLDWQPIDKIDQMPLPQANKLFLPHVLGSGTFYQAKYIYDDDEQIIKVVEHAT